MQATDRFQVQAQDGRTFQVTEWTEMIRTDQGLMRGLGTLTTAEGYAVNNRGNGEYEIVVLGLSVRRL